MFSRLVTLMDFYRSHLPVFYRIPNLRIQVDIALQFSDPINNFTLRLLDIIYGFHRHYIT